MKTTFIAGLLASMLLAAPAWAQRTPEPVVDYRDQMVATGSGQAVQAEQFKQAVVNAATRLRLWTLAYEPGGAIIASRAWNDHVIAVSITFTGSAYSIVYSSSTNMKYSASESAASAYPQRNANPRPKGPVIHPFYNRYVGELKDAIGAELRKL